MNSRRGFLQSIGAALLGAAARIYSPRLLEPVAVMGPMRAATERQLMQFYMAFWPLLPDSIYSKWGRAYCAVLQHRLHDRHEDP